MNSTEIVAIIKPGSISTKIAIYNRSDLIKEHSIRYSQEELDPFRNLAIHSMINIKW
jgi:butyrate kinase